MRHVLDVLDLSADEVERLFDLAADLKARLAAGVREPLLAGKVLGLLFEKPSLRTRVSFEAGAAHLGATTIFLGEDAGFGKREAPQDFARVFSRYVDAIVFRSKAHASVELLAKYSSVPVINGLSDRSHPCQALADLFTLSERCGGLAGRKLAYVGDANNVARSLAETCAMLGVAFSLAAPAGYQFADEFFDGLRRRFPQAKLEPTEDPRTAVRDADAVYTDVWASMGQEAERETRKTAFAAYQVTPALMSKAAPGAIFLHCLPARRGEEVTDAVMDAPTSAVVEQAANRMHVQKALLARLLGEGPRS